MLFLFENFKNVVDDKADLNKKAGTDKSNH